MTRLYPLGIVRAIEAMRVSSLPVAATAMYSVGRSSVSDAGLHVQIDKVS
jgi:hypothetical protein